MPANGRRDLIRRLKVNNVATDVWNILVNVQYLQLVQLWMTFRIKTQAFVFGTLWGWIRNNLIERAEVTTEFYSGYLNPLALELDM